MKLAQLLSLRKSVAAKVQQLTPIKQVGENGLFELQTKRVNVSENVDQVTFQVPRITLADVTKEYDKYARALREIDNAINEANWTTEVSLSEASLGIAKE